MINDEKFINTNLLKDGREYDIALIWLVLLMVSFSLLVVFSASIPVAEREHHDIFFYLKRQVFFAVTGGFLAFIATRVPLVYINKYSHWIFILSLIALVAVLIMGRNINGARRWISLGVFNLQPTEIFKVATILYMSSFFTRRQERLKQLSKVWWISLPITLGLGLIIFEPDLGSVVVVSVISITLLFLVGLPLRWFMLIVSIGIVIVAALIIFEPYRMARVTAFRDPFADPFGSGYQLTHSLMAIGRGGWTGVGLGGSIEKQFYLTDAHTDFIFAVISEEFGFAGMIVLVGCYLWLVFRAISIGKQAHNLNLFFGSFIAYGIAIWLGFQSFVHIGVNLGGLPTKGLTLPLISYGGSAMIMILISIGLLLRVDYENRRVRRGFPL